MKRLTKKREDGLYEDIDEVVVTNCSNKLGQIEDIEEELGVDLITLLKALENGFYYKYEHYGIDFVEPNDDCLEEILYGYGKSWALTKEELL